MKATAIALVVVALLNHVLTENLDWASLNRLCNSKVVSAQRYVRPLVLDPNASWLIKKAWPKLKKILPNHCGVVVTLEDGKRWLVQKGDEYGRESQTIVVDTKYMSPAWTAKDSLKRIQSSTVSDYVRAGAPNYSLIFDNCIHACNKMMRLS